MEYLGFLPISWTREENIDLADGQIKENNFVKVTKWKTLLVCAVDFIVVLGKGKTFFKPN